MDSSPSRSFPVRKAVKGLACTPTSRIVRTEQNKQVLFAFFAVPGCISVFVTGATQGPRVPLPVVLYLQNKHPTGISQPIRQIDDGAGRIGRALKHTFRCMNDLYSSWILGSRNLRS